MLRRFVVVSVVVVVVVGPSLKSLLIAPRTLTSKLASTFKPPGFYARSARQGRSGLNIEVITVAGACWPCWTGVMDICSEHR